MEYGNAIGFTGNEPTPFLLNLLRKQAIAHGQDYQLRRNKTHAAWVSNPQPKRIKEFPILIEEHYNGQVTS